MTDSRTSKELLLQRLRTWPLGEIGKQAADEIERLQGIVLGFVEGPPAQMGTPLGMLPINSTGMRQLVDALNRATAEPPAALCVDPAFEGTRCPFTKLPYFMHLEHPELGRVPTYGGPYDSYTIPVPDDDDERTLRSERYDHDEGAWIEGGEPWPMNLVTNEEFVDLHTLREERASSPPPAGQEPRSFAPWRVPDPPRTDAVEALRPFVELFEKSNERYRKRGGDPDQFADSHPFREITARELPLGVWRRAQAAMRAPSPPAVRRCNHGAISPNGTMFYHGFVSNQFNQWRCDVCRGVYEGNLTEPMNPGSQSLTLTAPPPAESDPNEGPIVHGYVQVIDGVLPPFHNHWSCVQCGRRAEYVKAYGCPESCGRTAPTKRAQLCGEYVIGGCYCALLAGHMGPCMHTTTKSGVTDSVPIGEVIAEQERDPEMKRAMDEARAEHETSELHPMDPREWVKRD